MIKLIKIILLILIFTLSFQKILYANNNSLLVNKISKNLRCLICQGQSVYDSNPEFALSVKSLISQKLAAGKTEEDIYGFLKSKYGDWIVYEPEINKYTLLLWLLPLFLFIFGGLLIVRKVFINTVKK